MIKVHKAESYAECNNCHSSKDVFFITLGNQHTTSVKLCNECTDYLKMLIGHRWELNEIK